MKKRTIRKTVSLCLLLALIISCMCLPASAISPNEDSSKTMEVSGTKVNLFKNAIDIPEEIILDIVSSNPEAGIINVYDWGRAEENNLRDTADSELPVVDRNGYMYYLVRTEKTVTNANAVGKEEFKFSVAKGEETTLTEEFSASLSGNFTGSPYESSQLGVSGTITGKYAKGTKYSGPPESSPYNSRQFWLRFYEERGNYTQYKDYYNAEDSAYLFTTSTSGTYKKATTWASYSIDSYLS